MRQDVTDFVDFTGRTDAVEATNIVARVTGYLVEMPFKEGSEVKKGDLLFKVDPRPYQAQLDQAQGQVELYQAQLELAKVTHTRFSDLYKTNTGAVSKQQLDQYSAQVAEAQAQLKAYQSSLEVYRLNVDFTNVTSPIDGRVSRYYLTLGNLVNADSKFASRICSRSTNVSAEAAAAATLLAFAQRLFSECRPFRSVSATWVCSWAVAS